jgi:hypothetical protein
MRREKIAAWTATASIDVAQFLLVFFSNCMGILQPFPGGSVRSTPGLRAKKSRYETTKTIAHLARVSIFIFIYIQKKKYYFYFLQMKWEL